MTYLSYCFVLLQETYAVITSIIGLCEKYSVDIDETL